MFAPNANGLASKPVRIIAGPKTGFEKFYGASGLAIGTTGKIYFSDDAYGFGSHHFTYPANANGDVPPLQHRYAGR